MRLKNKKTGEIIDVDFIYPETAEFFYPNFKLVDFNELFEDYEEPKEYWCIDCFSPDGLISKITGSSLDILENRKSIGNYFDTREEAEKAVEKLKAWKRLKDKGVRIVGWDYSDNVDLNGCKFIDDDFIVGLSDGDIDEEDLDLLFGGEE